MSDAILEALSYNPETGIITWVTTRRRDLIGGVAGHVGKRDGYVYVRLARKLYLAHRLAWRMYYGVWPTTLIDHINCNRADNRIENLREATVSQNLANRGVNANNTSGFRGVTFCPVRGKWYARIQIDKKPIYLGLFATAEEANAARSRVAKAVYGEFYREAA